MASECSVQVVFLHGFTGSPASWSAVQAASRRAYHCNAPYLAGHGTPYPAVRSDAEAPFEAEIDRLAHYCEARGVSAAPRRVVCGYSLGARVALGLLIRHPTLFTSALLIGVHPGLATPNERAQRLSHDAGLAHTLQCQGLAAFLSQWEQLPLFASQKSLPSEVLQRQARIRRGHMADGLAHSLRACGLGQMPNYLPALPDVRARMSVVVGGADTKFLSLARAVAAQLTHARLDIVPDCGHNVPLEAPSALAALLDDHLS